MDNKKIAKKYYVLVSVPIVLVAVITILLISHSNKKQDYDSKFDGFRPGSDRTIVESADCNNSKLRNDIFLMGFPKDKIRFEKCREVRRDSYFNEPKHFEEYSLEIDGKTFKNFLKLNAHEDRPTTAYTQKLSGLPVDYSYFTVDSFLNDQIEKLGSKANSQSLFTGLLKGKTVFITHYDIPDNQYTPVIIKIIYGKESFHDPKVTKVG